MPFTIVVVTPLIAIMKDQVEHLNKIGVAAAMMEEDVDEAVKAKAVKLYTEVPNRGFLRNGQKDSKKESLESKLQLLLLTRSSQSPNNKFSPQYYCCAFSLL